MIFFDYQKSSQAGFFQQSYGLRKDNNYYGLYGAQIRRGFGANNQVNSLYKNTEKGSSAWAWSASSGISNINLSPTSLIDDDSDFFMYFNTLTDDWELDINNNTGSGYDANIFKISREGFVVEAKDLSKESSLVDSFGSVNLGINNYIFSSSGNIYKPIVFPSGNLKQSPLNPAGALNQISYSEIDKSDLTVTLSDNIAWDTLNFAIPSAAQSGYLDFIESADQMKLHDNNLYISHYRARLFYDRTLPSGQITNRYFFSVFSNAGSSHDWSWGWKNPNYTTTPNTPTRKGDIDTFIPTHSGIYMAISDPTISAVNGSGIIRNDDISTTIIHPGSGGIYRISSDGSDVLDFNSSYSIIHTIDAIRGYVVCQGPSSTLAFLDLNLNYKFSYDWGATVPKASMVPKQHGSGHFYTLLGNTQDYAIEGSGVSNTIKPRSNYLLMDIDNNLSIVRKQRDPDSKFIGIIVPRDYEFSLLE